MTIKAAIIAGIFGLFGATCGMIGTILPTIATYFSDQQHPTVQVVAFENFGWLPRIYLDDPLKPNEPYRIVAGTCVEGFTSQGVAIKPRSTISSTSSPQHLQGNLIIAILTDKPIVIERVELIIEDYMPLDTNMRRSIRFIPLNELGQGGGGPVNIVNLEPLTISPLPEHIDLLKGRQYQLTGRDALTFKVPATFQMPGTYTYHVTVTANTYNVRLAPIKTPSQILKWTYISNLNPAEIQLPSDLPDYLKGLQFRPCS